MHDLVLLPMLLLMLWHFANRIHWLLSYLLHESYICTYIYSSRVYCRLPSHQHGCLFIYLFVCLMGLKDVFTKSITMGNMPVGTRQVDTYTYVRFWIYIGLILIEGSFRRCGSERSTSNKSLINHF